MKNYLELMLTVVRAILGYCTNPRWSPVVQSLPAMQQGVVNLIDKTRSIDDLIGQQKEKITGFTKTRQRLRNTLAIVSFTQLRAGMAYARKTNEGLYSSLNFSLSALKRMDFATIGQVMGKCHKSLSAIPIANLTPYGLSVASLQNWADAIKTYNDYISTPRNKMADRKSANEMLTKAVQDANDYLRTELTPLAETFVQSNEQFYLGFKANLKLIPVAVRHNRLDATVVDELGNACVNCTVTVDELTKNGKTYKAASAQTGIDGTCTVIEFEAGIRTVTVSGKGMQTKTFAPLEFKNTKGVTATFVCAPSFNNLPVAKELKEKVSK